MNTRVIINSIIPVKGFKAMAVWPFVFARHELSAKDENHERIHFAQQAEMMVVAAIIVAGGVIFSGLSPWWLLTSPLAFYVWYGIEWLVRMAVYRDRREAYRNISTEQEAYLHETDVEYLGARCHFAWLGYLFRKSWRRK